MSFILPSNIDTMIKACKKSFTVIKIQNSISINQWACLNVPYVLSTILSINSFLKRHVVSHFVQVKKCRVISGENVAVSFVSKKNWTGAAWHRGGGNG